MDHLAKFGFPSYAAYLASDRWKKQRLRFFNSEHFHGRCACCDSVYPPHLIQLHHSTYERLGDELLTDFIPLCRRCHQFLHGLHPSSNGKPLPIDDLWTLRQEFRRKCRYEIIKPKQKHKKHRNRRPFPKNRKRIKWKRFDFKTYSRSLRSPFTPSVHY